MGNYEIKKARAIALTVEGHTQKAIAEALTVDTRTIRRWAKEPDFVAALKEERESALALAKAHTASMYLADIEEGRASNQFLVKVRDSSNLEVKTRMRAATLLMNQALKSAAQMIKEEQAERQAPRVSEQHAKSGQKRTEADTPIPEEVTIATSNVQSQQAPTPSEKPDETGQKRTFTPTEELRAKALKNCELQMEKLDHIDNLAQELIQQGGEPEVLAELEKYRDEIETSRQNIDGVQEALENASVEELQVLLEKTGGEIFNLKIEMPKFKPRAA